MLEIASVYHGNNDGSAALGHIPRKRQVGPTLIGASRRKSIPLLTIKRIGWGRVRLHDPVWLSIFDAGVVVH